MFAHGNLDAPQILRRIDDHAHEVHHLPAWLTPWSDSHDGEGRSRICRSSVHLHGLACLHSEASGEVLARSPGQNLAALRIAGPFDIAARRARDAEPERHRVTSAVGFEGAADMPIKRADFS